MTELIISITGLFFSIIFSSSEIALISAHNLQLKVWMKQKVRGSKLALSIMNNPEEYLTVILIGTNLSNIITTSFATLYLTNYINNHFLLIMLIASIILFLGEIIPKILNNSKWGIFSKSLPETQTQLKNRRANLQELYEQVDDPIAMEKEQQDMISQVFEFSESTLEEVMTPRTDISSIHNTANLEEVMHVFIDSGHSKIPVYKNNIDNITGIIYLYDLYKSPKDINDIVKPITFFPYSKSVIPTLKDFQKNNTTIAIILDEHGGTAGLVTVEDLFEGLFGEFYDEFDTEFNHSDRLPDGSIIANGKMEWEIFNKKYGDVIPKGEYETVAGYIISEIGRIPNKGERLYLDVGQIVIRNATSRSIKQVQLFIK